MPWHLKVGCSVARPQGKGPATFINAYLLLPALDIGPQAGELRGLMKYWGAECDSICIFQRLGLSLMGSSIGVQDVMQAEEVE